MADRFVFEFGPKLNVLDVNPEQGGVSRPSIFDRNKDGVADNVQIWRGLAAKNICDFFCLNAVCKDSGVDWPFLTDQKEVQRHSSLFADKAARAGELLARFEDAVNDTSTTWTKEMRAYEGVSNVRRFIVSSKQGAMYVYLSSIDDMHNGIEHSCSDVSSSHVRLVIIKPVVPTLEMAGMEVYVRDAGILGRMQDRLDKHYKEKANSDGKACFNFGD